MAQTASICRATLEAPGSHPPCVFVSKRQHAKACNGGVPEEYAHNARCVAAHERHIDDLRRWRCIVEMGVCSAHCR